MSHHRAVGKLDHGVNLRLALHDHVNEIEVAVKQMHGLDTLQAFVHEGGGVDGDLGTHGPRGMREGIGDASRDRARHAYGQRTDRPSR